MVVRARGSGLETKASAGRSPTSRFRISPTARAWPRPFVGQRRVALAGKAFLEIGLGLAMAGEIKRDAGLKLQALMLGDGDVGRVFRLHAHDMIAGIDMQAFAGHRAAQIGQQEQRRIADFRRCVTVRRSGELYSFHFRM